MSGKFIKVKRVVVPMAALVLLSTQLMGCAALEKEQESDVSSSTFVQVEVTDNTSSTSTPEEKAPVEKVEPLKWSPLYSLMSYSNIRNVAKEVLGIKALEGSVFIDLDGHQEMNNTLYNALRNEEFAKTQLENKEITDKLCEAVKKTFADIGETENEQMAAFFNSFWELLPEENGKDSVEFNGSKALTRAQAMTLVMRAMTPVEKNNKPNENKLFTEAVGDSVYTDFAQYLDSKAYLNTQSGLNEKTFNANMTRAEYIWLCLSSVFTESELNEIDISGVELSDCVASTSSDSSLDSAIANPSNGLPVELVNMLKKANALEIISSDTDWERSVTKTDAIDLFVNTVKAYSEKFGYAIKQDTPKDDELLIAKAKASYERNKDKVTINEEKYVSEYIRLANQGYDEPDIEGFILDEFGKRPEPVQSSSSSTTKPVEKPAESKPAESKPTQSSSSSSTVTPIKYTGELKKPGEEVQIIGEREFGVNIRGRETSGYLVQTPGGTFWFCETNGGYFRSKQDCLEGKPIVPSPEVFPNLDWDDFKNITLS